MKPVLMEVKEPGMIPEILPDGGLNNYYTYPVTTQEYSINGQKIRIMTVGATGYPTINFLMKPEDIGHR